jgi:hypothetical protein
MLVEVIVPSCPYVGKKGARKDIPLREAKVLMMLGKVAEVKELPKPRRTYRRKDLVAAPVVEAIAPYIHIEDESYGDQATVTIAESDE